MTFTACPKLLASGNALSSWVFSCVPYAIFTGRKRPWKLFTLISRPFLLTILKKKIVHFDLRAALQWWLANTLRQSPEIPEVAWGSAGLSVR